MANDWDLRSLAALSRPPEERCSPDCPLCHEQEREKAREGRCAARQRRLVASGKWPVASKVLPDKPLTTNHKPLPWRCIAWIFWLLAAVAAVAVCRGFL